MIFSKETNKLLVKPSTKMSTIKKYLYIFIVLIVLASFAIFFLSPKSNDAVNHSSQENLSSTKKINQELTSFQIPPHINLADFYQTYGQRLLGNDDLKIISRDEWGANNNFANLDYINNLCQKITCSLKEYDPEDSFLEKEYLRARELFINYQNNFQNYNNLFLQTKKKENGINYQYLPIEEFIIHHTAGNFTLNLEDSIKEIQRIYLLHAILRRWRDIGYHFLIDGKGRIFEGSLGGKYSVGAHTYYHNEGSIGIALMGDFRKGHNVLTKEMKDSLIKLILYLKKEYKLDLSNKEFYLKKPDLSGREWSDKFIKGHKELDIRLIPTACPGIEPSKLREMVYPYLFSF